MGAQGDGERAWVVLEAGEDKAPLSESQPSNCRRAVAATAKASFGLMKPENGSTMVNCWPASNVDEARGTHGLGEKGGEHRVDLGANDEDNPLSARQTS